MKYNKFLKKGYTFTCRKCGNKFEKEDNYIPNKCSNCHGQKTFDFKKGTIEIIEQLCPICNEYFETRPYLNKLFTDEHARWVANMVTHYRHAHITSWNKMWGYHGQYYTSGWYNGDYDDLKRKINERAKRQILKKCEKEMKADGFKVDHVKLLKNTDAATLKLYVKKLGG